MHVCKSTVKFSAFDNSIMLRIAPKARKNPGKAGIPRCFWSFEFWLFEFV